MKNRVLEHTSTGGATEVNTIEALRRRVVRRSRNDGRARTGACRPVIERLEERVAMATDLVMVSATTRDSRSVEVAYRVDGDGGSPLGLAIFRSADANLDPSDVGLAAQTITDPAAITAGSHTLTV